MTFFKTGGVVALIAILSLYPIIELRIKEYPYKYNHFTNSYEVIKDGHNLSGKVAIVTGSNTGIGKETAKQLYGAGMVVVMACRNLQKANKAKQDIINEMGTNQGTLIPIRLDLSDLRTIDEFVKQFENNKIIDGRLDFLINNAGVMAFPEYGVTTDGIERQFGINHIGHFYLTNKLMKILKKNKGRIINVSSTAHLENYCDGECIKTVVNSKQYKGPIPSEIEYTKDGFTYYGISKLSNVLFTRQLNKLYHKDGIIALTLHPGVILTELSRHMNTVSLKGILLGVRIYHKIKSISQGASTTLRCVIINKKDIFENGNMDDIDNMALYFHDTRPQNDKINRDFRNGANQTVDQKLWDYSVKMIQSLDYVQLNDI